MLQTMSNLLLVCHTVSQIGDMLHHMTTVFGPFKLLTCSLLQKGWDHFPPKTFSEKSSSCFVLTDIGQCSQEALLPSKAPWNGVDAQDVLQCSKSVAKYTLH